MEPVGTVFQSAKELRKTNIKKIKSKNDLFCFQNVEIKEYVVLMPSAPVMNAIIL